MNNHASKHEDDERDALTHSSAGSKPSGCGGSCAGCAGFGDSLYPPYNPFEHMEEMGK